MYVYIELTHMSHTHWQDGWWVVVEGSDKPLLKTNKVY